MRRGRILILLGLILAIGTAAAVYVVVNSMEPSQTSEIVLEEVVVALQPIAEEEPDRRAHRPGRHAKGLCTRRRAPLSRRHR